VKFWKFFPCSPGTKTPALQGDWRAHATADEAQIDAWQAEGYNLAIDCEASGLTVIDTDGGPVGEATWARLCDENGLAPETYTVRTPKGGKHRYFQGDCPSSVQKLGKKVDTRGQGGYVLWEGTTQDGEYTIEHDVPVVPLPAWVAPLVGSRKSEHKAAVEELDLPVNLRRAERFLKGLQPVVQGHGADARTYEVAAALRDLGVSQEVSVDLMLSHYDCTPQDDRFEAFIARKVENVWSYAQNEPGAWGASSGTERFAAYASPGQAETPGSEDDSRFRLWSVDEALERPEPVFLLPGILPAIGLCPIVGPPDNGKTFIALDMALHVASGIAGWGRPESRPRDVVFYSGEGFDDVVHNRVMAWCKAHDYDKSALKLHFLENFANVLDDSDMDAMVAAIIAKELKPAMIVIDTYSRALTEAMLDENSAKEVNQWVKAAEGIKRGFRCAIVPIHHTGKDPVNGGRGSNALYASADAHFIVEANWEHRVFCLTQDKLKGWARAAPMHFEANVIDRSLVLRGITPETYRSVTAPTGGISGRALASALQTFPGPVSTHVLATALYVPAPGESVEETQDALERLERKLRTGAKEKWAIFCEGTGRDLNWALPSRPE
jgi:hypothetical protein